MIKKGAASTSSSLRRRNNHNDHIGRALNTKVHLMDKCPFVLLILSSFWVVGCEPEPPKPTLNTVTGEWVVTAAQRNERKTQLLNGTYFAFSPNGSMRSNLPLYESLNEWSSPFVFSNDSTLQFGNPPLNFTVKNWTDTTLNLEFTARGLPFYLHLSRANGPIGVQDTLE